MPIFNQVYLEKIQYLSRRLLIRFSCGRVLLAE